MYPSPQCFTDSLLRLEEEFVDERGVEEGDLLLVVELLPGGV